ncbi:MAG: 3-methyl-2-oxobutanoate hydroxymethyltransferase, partial [Planctomycetota bacterium]
MSSTLTGQAANLEPDSTKSIAPAPSAPARRPVTVKTISRFVARDEKFACLTCYDYTTARWLEQAGVPLLLVGDTAAEMILGLPGTIHAPLEFLL